MDEDGGGTLLVPRSVRIAMHSLEAAAAAAAKEPRAGRGAKRASDADGWAADAAAPLHAVPIVAMRGGGLLHPAPAGSSGGGGGGSSGVRRLVGAGVEDTGAPQVRPADDGVGEEWA